MPQMVAKVCVVLAALTTPQIGAAQTGFSGEWVCKITYTDLTPQGQRISGFTRDFRMIAHPDGTFVVQGTQAGADGSTLFQSYGEWQAHGDRFIAHGPEQSNAMVQIPGMVFSFMGTANQDGTLSHTYESRDPSQRHVTDRTTYFCKRQE
ncbi:MAG: hypothetical protein Q7J57_08285 [Gemmobacter sp.]|nr:hypothetical protein [Gemmobacter sp.]